MNIYLMTSVMNKQE